MLSPASPWQARYPIARLADRQRDERSTWKTILRVGFRTLCPSGELARPRERVCREHMSDCSPISRSRVTATFFVLGGVAERFPGLVRTSLRPARDCLSRLCAWSGVCDKPEKFRTDLRRARAAIEAAAACLFSDTARRASRLPSSRYGAGRADLKRATPTTRASIPFDRPLCIPDCRATSLCGASGRRIWELPGSTVRWAGLNFPMGEAGIFGCSVPMTSEGITRVNRVEQRRLSSTCILGDRSGPAAVTGTGSSRGPSL